MHKQTGEIKPVKEIPKEELGEWSKPFKVDDMVPIKGVKMIIVKIKQLRKEIHLQYRKDINLFIGEIVNFNGVPMKVIKVKQARKRVHLQFAPGSEVDDAHIAEDDE